MNEYTFENLIMNPETPGLENLIGKKVYSGTAPLDCLKRANKDYEVGILREIRKDCLCPFLVEVPNGMIFNYICIIPKKKEPKPEYVPFESMDEFLERYAESKERAEFGSFEGKLNQYGIWLKDKDRDVYCLVTEIWNYGVVVGDSNMNTTKDGDEYFTINEDTKWKQLLREYTFLDDSPCGKLMEE